jgi:hypothetical protein
MQNKKDIEKSLQVLLWLWFGTITSFVSVNVVNIVRLEAENKLLKENITMVRKYLIETSTK